MSTAAVFTIAKIGSQPKCPSAGIWTEKMWCGHTRGGRLYSATKRNKLCVISKKKQMELEISMLNSRTSLRKIQLSHDHCHTQSLELSIDYDMM